MENFDKLVLLSDQNPKNLDILLELAKDLKILIREKLIAGVSNKEIYGYLRERYGDYILLKPPLNLNTFLLWFLPFIVLLFGSILTFKIIKSNQK